MKTRETLFTISQFLIPTESFRIWILKFRKVWRIQLNMTYQRRGYDDIQKKWAPIAKEDPIEALLAVEKDLGLFTVVRNYKWDDHWYSKLPTSQVPKNVKNAEIINAILVKSWETQGSDCPSNPQTESLASNLCQCIHGLLMYYFKSMNIADNMERIVGLLSQNDVFPPFVHSFLALNDNHHVIDNTFVLGHIEHCNTEFDFNYFSTFKYIDTDPADPEYYMAAPFRSDVGK